MPPGFPGGWDDIHVWNQSKLIAYSQVMDHDENPPIKEAKSKLPKRR